MLFSGEKQIRVLPNHDTRRQDYSAASFILHGGLPELILFHTTFLKL
jgi:hypothetical protein